MNEIHPGPEIAEGTRPTPVQIPWEDPEQPRLSALVVTLRRVLSQPGIFFASLPGQGWTAPLSFGLIIGSFSLLASTYLGLLLNLALSQRWQGMPGLSTFMDKSTSALIALMILTPIIILTGLVMGSGCLWAVLRLMGVATDFSSPLRITCYAQGALVAALVPVLGSLAAILWNFYLTYKGVQGVFRLTSGRALAAVLLSLALEAFLFLLLAAGLGIFLVMWLY